MYPKEIAIRDARYFVKLVKENGITVTQAYLFGSYSKDCPGESSDIDVALISPEFSGFAFDDLGKIARAKLQSNPDLEIHPFKDKDFNGENPFAVEIKATGILID